MKSPRETSSEMFAPVCSIMLTKRRRFFWAAWWTSPPVKVPYRKPDASGGGAASHEQALAAAERAAGVALVVIDPLWVRAWMRLLRGESAWPTAASREPRAPRPVPAEERTGAATEGASVWEILGVSQGADEATIKRAYRERALETHPDRGGDAERFQRVLRAYAEARRRAKRPRRR